MAPDVKLKPYSPLDVIRISIQFVGCNHRFRAIFLFVIVILTLICDFGARRTWYSIHDMFKDVETTENSQKLLMCLLLVTLTEYLTAFIRNYLFEVHHSRTGSIVASNAMKNIFYSDRKDLLEIPGGQIEYYITAGSRGVAKVGNRFIISLLPQIIRLYVDLEYIFNKDESTLKLIFICVLIGSSLITLLKMWQLRITMPHLRTSLDVAYDREKFYTETIDCLPIVKLSSGYTSTLSKYDLKSQTWIIFHFIYKFLLLLNSLVYEGLSIVFKTGMILLFVKNNPNLEVNKLMMMIKGLDYILISGGSFIKTYEIIEECIVLANMAIVYLKLADLHGHHKVRKNMFNDKIEVTNVTYFNRDHLIFKDVCMTLNRGDKAVLYGRNGVGKSSIFKLLMNFADWKGGIFIDGVNIDMVNNEDYYSLITYVPQETKLLDLSIYENLAFGNSRSFQEIVTECIRMKIHDKIMMLPQGYNTVVGEGGKFLNGGLRQKIYYTRAFLRDTPIYLLDEPTNNLDPENSEFLMEYINDPKYLYKTFFVICHDQELIEKFPKIYKFEENQIILVKG